MKKKKGGKGNPLARVCKEKWKVKFESNKIAWFEALAFKSKFMQQFEFSGNFREFLWKMLRENNVLLPNNFFYMNLNFLKNSNLP